ncbi:hypothetical protein F5Y13DRAFT_57623 [Hypoxylon sp. FL1857]|nr:hypothetical protein F5Y13DRAFT_57623 [Hypoxylon sp. FL1857]
MTDYHVRVRDYHWSHHNIVVQSPILDLNASAAIPIIRPLEGTNKHEPRIIDDIADLKDDISNGEYRAEAHGVFVATDPRNPNRFPVWVPVQDYGCKAGKVHVVNLTSFEASHVSTAQICWIPGHEGPDGSLYTVIGAPRETIRATKVLVIVQKLGRPREARVTIVNPTELTEYGEVDKSQKKVLFEIQSWFIQTRTAPPSTITLNAYRVLFSPNRDTRGRLALEEVLDEDLEVPRASHSDCSSQSSFSSSGDEDLPYVKPRYVSLVEGSNVSHLSINRLG